METTAQLSISLDGCVAGPDQSLETPLGRRGPELHTWHMGDPRATEADAGATAWLSHERGAVVMGRNMFGPVRGEWDEPWNGSSTGWRTSPSSRWRCCTRRWRRTCGNGEDEAMTSDRKTRPTDASADDLVAAVDDDRRRADAQAVLELMREVTGVEPVVWGPSMIGFGTQPYTTADGKEREWFRVGLAPRKAALTLYGLTFYGSNADLLDRLGPHTTGKGCVYVKRLSAVDQSVLRELVERSWEGVDV